MALAPPRRSGFCPDFKPRKIIMDKLRSYGVAHRELMPDVRHDNSRYAAIQIRQVSTAVFGYPCRRL